jgi:thymidylate synthase
VVYENFIFPEASTALPLLFERLLDAGEKVPSRAGDTLELTHVGITLQQPWRREILTPERKPSIAAQVAETMWVLAGRNDIEWLARYLPRATDFSDNGVEWRAGYGQRLRRWAEVDQLEYVVDTLLSSPGSRQAVMTIWNPEIDTEPGKDIPCNNWLSFSIRHGKLDLMVAIRSNDAMWGWSGINQFEWSALQEVVAGLVGAEMGALHFAVTSFHLYEQHWEKAKRIAAAPRPNNVWADSPRFDGGVDKQLEVFDALCARWFDIEEVIRSGHDAHRMVDAFPEPMLQSWLRIIQWWWRGDESYLKPLGGTRLQRAAQLSVQPKADQMSNPVAASDFAVMVTGLHNEKHAAYGDSWKRRGEMLGIMANIARKIDRLGSSPTKDETSADTCIDLLVYLAKYETWLAERVNHGALVQGASDDPGFANEAILRVEREHRWNIPLEHVVEYLRTTFEALEEAVMQQRPDRYTIVDAMLPEAFQLARYMWLREQETSITIPVRELHAGGIAINGSWEEPGLHNLGFVGGDYDRP